VFEDVAVNFNSTTKSIVRMKSNTRNRKSIGINLTVGMCTRAVQTDYVVLPNKLTEKPDASLKSGKKSRSSSLFSMGDSGDSFPSDCCQRGGEKRRTWGTLKGEKKNQGKSGKG